MKIEIDVECELFHFDTEQEWVSKAKNWFACCGVPRGHYISVDANGRVCEKGKEFIRATKEKTYPITVYKLAGL